ncbi:MAG: hypothetical protein JWO24_1870 [Rhodospirillales bacterium]|nr:hypothetical protein [Rhodospirillales bacterium]
MRSPAISVLQTGTGKSRLTISAPNSTCTAPCNTRLMPNVAMVPRRSERSDTRAIRP